MWLLLRTPRLLFIAAVNAAILGAAVLGVGLTVKAQTPTPDQGAFSGPANLALQYTFGDDLEEDLDAALEALGEVVDLGVSAKDLFSSSLPSAAAAFNRILVNESADERYERLSRWTLPDGDRNSVRLFSCPVPTLAPPKSFARAIRQRPRDTTFAVAETGGVPGWFCSGWLLARAADEVGRLGRLTGELERLSEATVPGADEMLAIALASNDRGDVTLANKQLSDAAETPLGEAVVDLNVVSLALVGTRRDQLATVSLKTLEQLTKQVGDLRANLQTLHAMAVQRQLGESPMRSLNEDRLKYWVAARGQSASASSRGIPAPLWLTHEDHVLHLSGSDTNTLYCQFPLTGEFEFLCETQTGGPENLLGGLAYGGLHFAVNTQADELLIRDGRGNSIEKRHCPFARYEAEPVFNRVSIRGFEGSTHFEVNLHPMWRFDNESSAAGSWVGLRSEGATRGLFRNLKIRGEPTIPRRVELLAGDRLLGWRSDFFGTETNWSLQNKTLIGAKDESSESRPELLRLDRPLLSGETIGYQFQHRKGEPTPVHPVIGRMAFLLLPDGVRTRWLTDSAVDWTGLARDHTVLEPLSRRGPKPLPLESGQWNELQVTRTADSIELTLNGELIYDRELDFGGSRQFGFYREDASQEVRIDQIELSGDWPETLPADFRANPAVTRTVGKPSLDETTMRADGFHFPLATLSNNALAVRRMVRTSENPMALAALTDWVLPDANRPSVRFDGFFLPTFASPEVHNDPGFSANTDAMLKCLPTLRAPILDVLAGASLNQEFQDQVNAIDGRRSPYTRAGKTALRILLKLAAGEIDNAETLLVELQKQLATPPLNPANESTMWLELIAAGKVIDTIPSSRIGASFVSLVIQRHASDPAKTRHVEVQSQLASLQSRLNDGRIRRTEDALVAGPASEHWMATSDFTAMTCGYGLPQPQWQRNRLGDIVHTCGHSVDYLMRRVPLTGQYTVMAEMNPWASCQVQHGDVFVGSGNTKDTFELGEGRQRRRFVSVEKPWDSPKRSVHYRSEVSDQTIKTYLAGRLIRQRTRSEPCDPWLALRSSWRRGGWFRDVSVSGAVDIPKNVALVVDESLFGWHPYHAATIGTDDAHWQGQEDAGKKVLVGRRIQSPVKTSAERLLQYRRPLVEDGRFACEMFIGEDTDAGAVGLAIGRLALLISNQGISEHWVTDSEFDRTELRPDTTTIVAKHQRGEIELDANQFHRVGLQVEADQVTLTLNKQLVFQRVLPAGIGRKIGLFHFADQEPLKVRDATLSGDWGGPLTSRWDDLAEPQVADLDAGAAELPDRFEHSFSVSKDADAYVFDSTPSKSGEVRDHDQGRFLSAVSDGSWVQKVLSARFSIEGDFDIEAGYSDLNAREAIKNKNALLAVDLSGDLPRQCAVSIGHHQSEGHELKGQLVLTRPDKKKSHLSERVVDESTSGRLRIARRGDQVYLLHAPGDSPRYRLISVQETPASEVPMEGVKLIATVNGGGSASVVWTDMTILAERLRYQPPKAAQPMYRVGVIDVASRKARILAEPVPPYNHVGSLSWRPDGKFLAYQQTTGSFRGSRLIVLPVSGGPPRDIGSGSLPNFSSDGRRIAFSEWGEGVGIQNIDGSGREIIDSGGWGIHWSHDGKTLAYTRGGNITLYDVASRRSRVLMTGEAARRYSRVYWNMAWSSDDRKIAFKASRPNNLPEEIALVDLKQPDRVRVLLDDANHIAPDVGWSPDDRELLISNRQSGGRGPSLYRLPVDGQGKMQRLENHPESWDISHGECSPDGQQIAIAGKHHGEIIEWNE